MAVRMLLCLFSGKILPSLLGLLCVVPLWACGGPGAVTADGGEEQDAGVLCEPTCEVGSSCIAGSCCENVLVCGESCCSSGSVCSFGECLIPGNDCYDSSECDDGEYCEATLGGEPDPVPMNCVGSTAPQPGKCLPSPPMCADGEVPDDPSSCLVACEYRRCPVAC